MSVVHDLSIPLEFGGPQPSAFGAPPAHADALRAGAFVGAVAQGGSCECATLTLTPHCNGTHTESMRHLTGTGPAPFELLRDLTFAAVLVTVRPVRAAETPESSDPAPQPDDLVVTAAALADALASRLTSGSDTEAVPSTSPSVSDPEVSLGATVALIVRTLPNDPGKRAARWGERPAPFFTREAMELVAARFEHLLFDGPSLDRAEDGGKLCAHRVLWAARPRATVTELIYVPDAVADGPYTLSLQVPAFVSDAAPSRPLIQREPR